MIGICLIIRSAAENSNINEFILWSAAGTLVLFIAYMLFEFFTPVFRIDREIEAGNTAAGVIALAVSVGVSLVITACMG